MNREEITALKNKYIPGTRIKLIEMSGEKNPPAGTRGYHNRGR